jgi:hypothetical protein
VLVIIIQTVAMLFAAKSVHGNERSFVKALSFAGASAMYYGIVTLSAFSGVPVIIGIFQLAGFIGLIIYLAKMYQVSWLRGLGMYILHGFYVLVTMTVIGLIIGATFLPMILKLFSGMRAQ